MKANIDREYVQDLIEDVENSYGFQWDFSYEKHLIYRFIAEEYKSVDLTYNNNTIFEVKDSNGDMLFSRDCDEDSCSEYGENWYINFTRVPYAKEEENTISLSNIIFVNMSLDYFYYCGSLCALSRQIEQYVIVDENFEFILVYIPEVNEWVS